jgi:hypothetical protein
MNNLENSLLACKLTTPELQQRKRTVISNLKQHLLEKKELPDGFAFRYEGSDEMVNLVTEFIKTERQCCDFFNFTMAALNDSTLWLNITGPEGTKIFILTELEM